MPAREVAVRLNQQELPLPIPPRAGDEPLIPARMVNEYSYCPRLAYLEWVQGEWAESSDTVRGRYQHRRVDKAGGSLPQAGEADDDSRIHARSVTLSSDRLGLIAKMDLVEGEGNAVRPVDYKQGKRPHRPKGAWDPERIQVCVQGLILEEHGYECPEGILYFTGSRERVTIPFDDELREQTLSAINGLRLVAKGGQIPPPLEDSPKCPRCSLAPICLPDEVNFLKLDNVNIRPLAVRREESLPLYVQAPAGTVRKEGEVLRIEVKDQPRKTARIREVSQLVLMGRISVTTPALHELMAREIPITWHSYGGWFLGHSQGTGHKNIELRRAQFRAADDPQIRLRLSRGLVRSKIQNCRTLMRRNWRSDDDNKDRLTDLRRLAEKARRCRDLNSLLGTEGAAGAAYFGGLPMLIKPGKQEPDQMSFDFRRRNRRPPADPVNALLSYAYALLSRQWAVTLSAVGFDPYLGFFHEPRYGRPALALDMMEPFRPLIADSTVLTAINNGEVRPADFIRAGDAVNLTPAGRKRFIATFERRMMQDVTHPIFGYRVSYRRLLELQARLLSRFLLGELPDFPHFTTR